MKICENTGHHYVPANTPYSKAKGVNEVYDQSVLYLKLFCSQCGETKEIIATDHRPKNEA